MAPVQGGWRQLLPYLALRQAEGRGELRLPPDGDVFAVVKLFLQLQTLVVGVNHPVLVFSPSLSIWKTKLVLVSRSSVRSSCSYAGWCCGGSAGPGSTRGVVFTGSVTKSQ